MSTQSQSQPPTRPTPLPSLAGVPLTQVDAERSDTLAAELQVGQRIGPFELKRLLGAGGMGQVFLADQLHPVQRQVALKFMQHRLASDHAAVRFEIERQALARMSHPAIAQVFEAGATADGFPYLAMEYVPGEPITSYCRIHGLDLRARLGLFIDAARGVQHAHQKHILHLDLKPANLLVSEVDGKPHPKIIDFGLAVSAVRIPGQRNSFALAGTPGYMSPEQAGVRYGPVEADVDARSDVYALGVVLYQLVAGAPPFLASQFSESSSEELRRHFDQHPVMPPSERLRLTDDPRGARDVAGDLDAIVARAMHREHDARYESVAELVDELQRWLEHRPVRARPVTRTHRARLYLRRNRLQVGVASALTLTLAAGFATATWGLLQARQERDLAAARQHELERVSEFQQSMLSGLDPAQLGLSLKASLQQQLAASLKGNPEAPARLTEFERSLALANPTEAARQLIDTQLLRRGLQAVASELADQPQVAAELRIAIANAYLAAGAYAAALDAADLALADLAPLLGPHHPKPLSARLLRAQLMKQLGRGREDLPALARLIADAREAGEAGAQVALDAGMLQSETRALEMGELADGVRMGADLLKAYEARFGADAPETIAALQVQAALVARKDGHAAATPLFERAMAALERRLGEQSPRTIAAIELLGNNLGMQGEFARALPLHRRAAELRRQVQGDQHPQTLQARNSLAITLSRTGELAPAIKIAREVLELRTRSLGRDHPQTLRSMLNLGAFLAHADDIEGAAAITRECYERRKAALGPDNPDVYTAGLNLADFEIIRGKASEGLRLAEEAHAQRSRLLGPDHGDTLVAEGLLGRALAAAGEYRRAIPLLEATVADAEESERAQAMAAWYLALAYRGVGRAAEAQALIHSRTAGLFEATHDELNPPERHALAQLKEYLKQ
ncbi:MAG: serine/threonine protein kinase [Rhodanobacteraceae bacterium]|nr:serine/threonine protein kinase [Rhodanobacteraceae bacterium]